MIEKLNKCPRCGTGSPRWLYDGQNCVACGYPYAFHPGYSRITIDDGDSETGADGGCDGHGNRVPPEAMTELIWLRTALARIAFGSGYYGEMAREYKNIARAALGIDPL